MNINMVKDFVAAQRSLIFPGCSVLVYMAEDAADAVVESVEALGARAVKAQRGSSYARLKAIMEESRAELCIAEPVELLSMLRACGKGSLRRGIVVSAKDVGTVINETEDILSTPLCICTGASEEDGTAALDGRLFSLGALVDCRISELKGGGYKLEGIYSGWMDARQIIDLDIGIVAIKLREYSMDDVPMYTGKRIIE